ncbi:MAG: alpha/beta hydrolase [Bacteroidales bacterium]
MKKIVFTSLLIILNLHPLFSQEEFTNRYAMKLKKESDGSFSLINRESYSKILDLSSINDLLVPYYHQSKKVSGKDYEEVISKEFVYKSYPGYVLKLAVDFAPVKTGAVPFMMFIHGGGWARGDFNSNRDLSKYCASKGGITGVRISYTLADKPGANILITIEDVKDAVRWVQANCKDLNVDPDNFGFMGGSAGGHLSAVAALSIPGTRVLVGVSGIYNLQSAKISAKATDGQRLKYFNNKDPETLKAASPVNLINKKSIPACYLIHGTGDITVEFEQTVEFAEILKSKGAKVLDVEIVPNYDHNISSTKSDLKEDLFLKMFNFITSNLNKNQ